MKREIMSRLILVSLIVFLSVVIADYRAKAGQYDPTQEEINANIEAKKDGRKLVAEFDELIKTGADKAALEKKALEMSQDFYARLYLKQDQFEASGKKYAELTKGVWDDDGNKIGKGLWDKLEEHCKRSIRKKHITDSRLRNIKDLDGTLKQLDMISNRSSRGKAGMDLDLGFLLDPNVAPEVFDDDYRKLLNNLGGTKGAGEVRDALQEILEKGYIELGKKYNVKVDPKRAFMEATSPFFYEAYRESAVLTGEPPSSRWVNQAVDVSNVKVNHFRDEYLDTRNPKLLGEAMVESARGTVKDLDKFDRVAQRIYDLTGHRPTLSVQNQKIRKLLECLANDINADVFKINAEIMELTRTLPNGKRLPRGRNIFDVCKRLMDNMHSAWVLMPFSPKGLMAQVFKKYLSPGDADKAVKALLDGDLSNLPPSATKIKKKLAGVAGMHLMNLEKIPPDQFLKKYTKAISDLGLDVNDKNIRKILEIIGETPEKEMRIFLGKAAPKYNRMRAKITPKVKANVAKRFKRNGLLLVDVDKRTGQLLLGDEGIAGFKWDVGINAAVAIWTTSSIMEQELSPDEEYRQLINAWTTALPVVGDFADAIIHGTEGYFSGDRAKQGTAAIFLVIGISYAVPGLQLPAFIASLGMMAHSIIPAYKTIQADKSIVEAWIDSGDWDLKEGNLKGIYDHEGLRRPVFPEEKAETWLIERGGNVGYHSPLIKVVQTDRGPTPVSQPIRESIYEYADRNYCRADRNMEICRMAIMKVYPDFKLAANLREEMKTGRNNLEAHIREKGDQPSRHPIVATFVSMKKYYNEAVIDALKKLKAEAEAEYRARYLGADVYNDLWKLGQKLDLKLYDHVNDMFDSWTGWAFHNVKRGFDRHSIPRQRLNLAERYLEGYKQIEAAVKKIKGGILKHGLKAPEHFSLTGYLSIDKPRIDDLESAYVNAIAKAGTDTKDNAREVFGIKHVFDLDDPCDSAIFKKLAQLQVNIMHANDWLLLVEQWSGKKSAAFKTRDQELARALDAAAKQENNAQYLGTGLLSSTEKKYLGTDYLKRIQKALKLDAVLFLPLDDVRRIYAAYEEAYAWAHMKWEGSTVYNRAKTTFKQRVKKLTKQYERAKKEAIETRLACAYTVIVKLLKKKDEDHLPSQPIKNASVYVVDEQGEKRKFDEKKHGVYIGEKLLPGNYTCFVSAKGYIGPDGEEVVEERVALPKPTAVKKQETVKKTIYLMPLPGRIVVTVVEEMEEKGEKPVSTAEASLIPSKGPSGEFRKVNDEGRIFFEKVLPGKYGIKVRAKYYKDAPVKKGIILDTEKPERSTGPVRITLSPLLSELTVKVMGRVEGVFEEPIEGALVEMGGLSGSTDSEGRITFTQVRPSLEGPYELKAEAEGYPPALEDWEVLPEKDGERLEKTLILAPGGSITVQVKDQETREPIPDADIQVFIRNISKSGIADSKGQFVFEKLPLGFHYVRASREGYLPVGDDLEVQLTAGDLEKSSVVELVAGMKVKVWVWDEKGDPIASCQVAMDGGKEIFGPTGTVEFSPVKKGEHRFKAAARGYSEVEGHYRAMPDKKSSDAFNIKLKPAMTITVEVRDPKRGLIRNAEVSLIRDGSEVAKKKSKGEEDFLFSGLGKGVYKARAVAPGYATTVSKGSVTLEGGKDGPVSEIISVHPIPHKSVLAVSVSADEGDPAISISIKGPSPGTKRGSSTRFSNLLPGKYRVKVSAKGYHSDTREISIYPGADGKIYEVGLRVEKKVDMEELERLVAEGLSNMTEEEEELDLHDLATQIAKEVRRLLKDEGGGEISDKELLKLAATVISEVKREVSGKGKKIDVKKLETLVEKEIRIIELEEKKKKGGEGKKEGERVPYRNKGSANRKRQ